MKIRQVCDLDDDAGKLAQRLRHQAGLQADMAVAHLAIEFGLGHQRRHRVHHQHVDRAGAHQRFGNLQRLLAVVGLRHQQVVDVDAQLGGVDRIERVLGIDEGCHAALLLRLRNDLQRDRRLARGLRPEDLNHAAARKAADAQRRVKGNRSRGNHGNRDHGSLASQLHDGALAKLLFDLRHRQVDCPAFFSFFVRHECRSLAALGFQVSSRKRRNR